MDEIDLEGKDLITVLGPTACGKTHLAVNLAHRFGGEILSADSRQVYRGMDIGTGKDLGEYCVDGKKIPYHLIDIVDPGYEYNVFEFQRDFYLAMEGVVERENLAIMCGGTGLYLEAIIQGYKMKEAPFNAELRLELDDLNQDRLIKRLEKLKPLHNTTDTRDKERLIRAIEIETFQESNPLSQMTIPKLKHHVFGIHYERPDIKKRITARLKQRMEEGMIEEVEGLIKSGVTPAQLKFYGLEYKYITQFIEGELNRNDMFQKLNAAIHQFAKRQMTWFRKMDRKGPKIHWIEGDQDLEAKINTVLASGMH